MLDDRTVIHSLCGEHDPSSQLSLSAEELRRQADFAACVGHAQVRLYRRDADAQDIRRLSISWTGGEIEVLPSKGLTIASLQHGHWRPFWQPVVSAVVSPEMENLTGEILVNGAPKPGMRWLENFSGSVELLGLSNWGLPRRDPLSGHVLPLHGEAARIPVRALSVETINDFIVVTGTFEVNHNWWNEPANSAAPWYKRGILAWGVTRVIVIDSILPAVQFVDTITNCMDEPAVPDWGYHIQLRAEDGARLRIPSRIVEDRFGGTVPSDYERWKAADPPTRRIECGYIHKGLGRYPGLFGREVVSGAVFYPSGSQTFFTMPAAPYTLSWFSAGGSGGSEFALPETPGKSISTIPWDGLGPEIGASAIDHDGNTDPEIAEPPVAPGDSTRLHFMLKSHAD